MEQVAALIAGEDKSLAEAVAADLQDKGICKLEITIEVVGNEKSPCGLDSSFPMPCDALASYILGERLYRRIVSACHHCRTAKDVVTRVYFLLHQSPIWDRRVMLDTPFVEALRPHLTNIKKEKTNGVLYKEIYHQFYWVD